MKKNPNRTSWQQLFREALRDFAKIIGYNVKGLAWLFGAILITVYVRTLVNSPTETVIILYSIAGTLASNGFLEALKSWSVGSKTPEEKRHEELLAHFERLQQRLTSIEEQIALKGISDKSDYLLIDGDSSKKVNTAVNEN